MKTRHEMPVLKPAGPIPFVLRWAIARNRHHHRRLRFGGRHDVRRAAIGQLRVWKLKPANPGFLETQMNRIHELETK